MELTLGEALNKGVEAHQAGQIQEAEGFYNGILRSQPNHPDANHNMGILTAGVDKMQESLAYFKIALEANPSVGQYWLSYIGALINLDKLDDAKVVFNQAKDIGVNGEAFDQLEHKLLEHELQANETNTMEVEGSNSPKPNILDTTKLDKALRLAKRTLKDGQLKEAKSIYEDILQKFPKHKQALVALQSLTEGTPVAPQEPPSEQLQLINNIYNQGKLQQALSHSMQMLNQFPNSVVLYNIAGASNVGLMQFDAAIANYVQVLKIKPNCSEAYYHIGLALNGAGEPNAAISSYKRAINIKPDYAEAYYNMGIILRDKGDLDAAIDSYKQAINIKPDYAESYNTMGIALNDKGDLDAAINSYKQAVKINPDHAHAYNNMGISLQDKGDLEAAVDSYKQALKIKPDHAEAYNNMGIILSDKGDLDAAIDSYKRAINIKPDYVEAYYNMSFPLLLTNNFEAGWPAYEWRFLQKDASTASPRDNVTWDGRQSLKGKHFLIYEEQGLGDIIQFCRYLPLLQEASQVTFKLTPKLHALIATISSGISLTSTLPNVSQIDFEAPLMSLPFLMGTNMDTIPALSPYLFVDDSKVMAWHKRLHSDTFKIGICWHGSKGKIAQARSFPLCYFKGISGIPGVELVSLHKGDGEEQLNDINFDVKTFGLDFDGGPDAFLDTAAVIMNCDLIITSDTAVAHLAGALGCQTWVVLQHLPDWRWMLNRTDSPWYPSMTLYRQSTRGDWARVFKIMEQDLRCLIG